MGQLDLFQEPRPAAGGGDRGPLSGRPDGPAEGQAIALDRPFQRGRHADSGLAWTGRSSGMNPGLGFVHDQDTNNLAMRYKGFQASGKRGETLGNYQEARIRRMPMTLDLPGGMTV